MACSTCKRPSHYVYRITLKNGIEYCKSCLPKFLVGRQKAGLLETTEDYKAAVEEGKKNIVMTVPEPTTEETEPKSEETKPKKKASKKKAE